MKKVIAIFSFSFLTLSFLTLVNPTDAMAGACSSTTSASSCVGHSSGYVIDSCWNGYNTPNDGSDDTSLVCQNSPNCSAVEVKSSGSCQGFSSPVPVVNNCIPDHTTLSCVSGQRCTTYVGDIGVSATCTVGSACNPNFVYNGVLQTKGTCINSSLGGGTACIISQFCNYQPTACTNDVLCGGSTGPYPTPNPTPAVNNLSDGVFDLADCDQFWGWACDKDDYSQPLWVHFYDGNPAVSGAVFLGGTIAGLPREPAVGNVCGGYVNHGFSMPAPASIKDGKTHSIYAFAINIPSGVNPPLYLSPRSYLCKTPTPSPIPTKSPSPTPSAKPTATPTSIPVTAQCVSTKIYSPNWTLITSTEYYDLVDNSQVYFCTAGSSTAGSFDMARFTINGVLYPNTTVKRTGSNDFCQLYTIPKGSYNTNVQGEIHHTTLGWL